MKKTTQVKACCFWCNEMILMPEGFDEKTTKPVCSPGCRDAEMLFGKLFSNKRLNRSKQLTKGG